MATTTHEVALFEEDDGWKFILVWIDYEDIETFEDDFSEDEWQAAIEQHPFVQSRKLPVVIAFEDENGEPRLYGPDDYVNAIAEEFDWDAIVWGYSLTLEWDEGDEDE